MDEKDIDNYDCVVDPLDLSDTDWVFDTTGCNGHVPTITIGEDYMTPSNNTMQVDGNIVCKDSEGNTIDVGDTLSAIQKRLAILTPDPKKLEQWEALREAYEHYKSLEALIGNTEPEDD